MANEIILTHTGKLGDMLYGLMVGSWLHRKFNRKIKWVLPRCFGPFRYIENLLMAQEQTASVTLVDHKVTDFSCGGQPYKFNPAVYGVEGEYFNLGFRGYPDKFLPLFYAEEYGLGFDPDFTLSLGGFPKDLEGKQIYRSSELAMQMLMPDVDPLPTEIDLLELARMIASAKEFHSWYCGLAVLCWIARIPAHVYRVEGHASLGVYFADRRTLTIHQLAKHPKEMFAERNKATEVSVSSMHMMFPLHKFRGTWSLIRDERHGEIYVHNWFPESKRHIANDRTLKLLGYDVLEVTPMPRELFDGIKTDAPISIG